LFIERKKGVVATKADKSADRREDDADTDEEEGGAFHGCEDARTVVVTLRCEEVLRTLEAP